MSPTITRYGHESYLVTIIHYPHTVQMAMSQREVEAFISRLQDDYVKVFREICASAPVTKRSTDLRDTHVDPLPTELPTEPFGAPAEGT